MNLSLEVQNFTLLTGTPVLTKKSTGIQKPNVKPMSDSRQSWLQCGGLSVLLSCLNFLQNSLRLMNVEFGDYSSLSPGNQPVLFLRSPKDILAQHSGLCVPAR